MFCWVFLFVVVVVFGGFFGVFFTGERGGLGGSDMIKGSNFFLKIGMVNVPFFFSCSKRGAFIFLKFSNCLNRDVVDCFTQTYLIELYFVFVTLNVIFNKCTCIVIYASLYENTYILFKIHIQYF